MFMQYLYKWPPLVLICKELCLDRFKESCESSSVPGLDVLVLDDHRMVAQAIAGVLSEVAGLAVLDVCTTTAEACAVIRRSPPGLLVLDVDLGDDSYRVAADLLHQLHPAGRLLFVTALAERFSPPVDLAAITVAVVDKSRAWDQLLAVLHPWLQQHPCLPEAMPACDQQLRAIGLLQPREQRLLRELGCGLLNKEIAARLELSVATVETYRKQVAAKLGISGAELVRLATLYRSTSWAFNQPPEG